MKLEVLKSRISQLAEQRNGYLVLSCGLTLLSFLLVILCFYLGNRERIIVTPPVIDHPFWITNSEVSSEYLTQMTLYYSYLRFNVTPDNADYQRRLLLRYTDSGYYGIFNDQLVADRDNIVREHINTVFYPSSCDVDAKALRATVTGDLISNVGTTQLPAQRVSYQWQYKYNFGKLLIAQLQEVKTHE